jgi:hypothetical protein
MVSIYPTKHWRMRRSWGKSRETSLWIAGIHDEDWKQDFFSTRLEYYRLCCVNIVLKTKPEWKPQTITIAITAHGWKNTGWGCSRIGCWGRHFAGDERWLEETAEGSLTSTNIRAIKSITIGWAKLVARMVSGKGQTGYWWVTEHLENQDVDGRKILKKK